MEHQHPARRGVVPGSSTSTLSICLTLSSFSTLSSLSQTLVTRHHHPHTIKQYIHLHQLGSSPRFPAPPPAYTHTRSTHTPTTSTQSTRAVPCPAACMVWVSRLKQREPPVRRVRVSPLSPCEGRKDGHYPHTTNLRHVRLINAGLNLQASIFQSLPFPLSAPFPSCVCFPGSTSRKYPALSTPRARRMP